MWILQGSELPALCLSCPGKELEEYDALHTDPVRGIYFWVISPVESPDLTAESMIQRPLG